MILLTHSQPLAAPRLPGVDVGGDAGGIAIGPGSGIVGPGGGVFAISPNTIKPGSGQKCLELVKI